MTSRHDREEDGDQRNEPTENVIERSRWIGPETKMSQRSPIHPPRLLPDRPFPPYAYVPGDTPHPTRDPGGHSYGAALEIPEPPDPEDWRACRDYLYGIDLFNHGFYWEAHEAWEGLWVASGRRGPTATYLQALISLAAAGLKARSGSARGMRANAGKAVRLFGRGSYCRAASWLSITERWRGRRYRD